MYRKAKWTHTATVLRGTHPVGAVQFGDVVVPGDVVEVYQDPALQSGNLISIRFGHGTGAVPMSDLTDYQAKEGN